MNPETTAERGKGDSESNTSAEEASERWRRTAIAAFYRAEARGFAPGGELDDWFAAERDLDSQSADPAPIPVSVEPVTHAGAPTPQRPAAKDVGRGRKSERSTGRNIGGMA